MCFCCTSPCYVECTIPLSHLKPILQRLVLIKNGRFPLLGRPLSTKFLEGRRREPLALALDALYGCTCTGGPCRNAFIIKVQFSGFDLHFLNFDISKSPVLSPQVTVQGPTWFKRHTEMFQQCKYIRGKAYGSHTHREGLKSLKI